MLLTVAICTLDRAASLRRALGSLADCEPPTGAAWELVVVNNGSRDDTSSVIEAFESALPIRAVAERTRGLSIARNAAVRASRGEYVLWTDDDCVVDRNWLVAYTAAVARWPDAAVFGGPIVPRFEGNPPSWLPRIAARIGAAYAAHDLGPEPVALSVGANRLPFGANYAVRAQEQRSHLYDARLGRGTDLPVRVGEESEVLRGLLRDGVRGRWVPDAIVTHCIPPERQTITYLRDYFAADGAYEEWRRYTASVDARSIDNPSHFQLLRRALRSEIRYRILRRVGEPEAWIDDLIAASVARGRAAARRALKREKRETVAARR